ncbi:hypothetical protein EDE11_11787 [Methylomonas methanica]|uniref:Uncharacterized protein n=1 Tax=Methylomonas methanica TaxID=421 RepID=A0ABY2CJ61_METMH|nr:hypothetical protein EDE11_11787 [Methylomonas methanica]
MVVTLFPSGLPGVLGIQKAKCVLKPVSVPKLLLRIRQTACPQVGLPQRNTYLQTKQFSTGMIKSEFYGTATTFRL